MLLIYVVLYYCILLSTFLVLLKLPLHFLEQSLYLFYLLSLNILILLLNCLFSFGLHPFLMMLLFLLLDGFLNRIHRYLLQRSSLVLILWLMYCYTYYLFFHCLHIQLFLLIHNRLFLHLMLVFVLMLVIFRYSLLLYLILFLL